MKYVGGWSHLTALLITLIACLSLLEKSPHLEQSGKHGAANRDRFSAPQWPPVPSASSSG
jgi:hypothetical protein